MKQFLLMIVAVALVGCGEDKSTVDVNLRAPGEPDECEHIWSIWESFSRNPVGVTEDGFVVFVPFAVQDWRRRYPDQSRGRSDGQIARDILASNPNFPTLYPELVRFADRNPTEPVPKYIPTTGELLVAYQTRTCSKCGKFQTTRR